MLGIFDVIKDKFKVKTNSPCIDNWVFKLHYRVTCIIFSIATILVTSREFIGEHIKCINDMSDPDFEKVIESFCFFTTTFTVVNDDNYDLFPYQEFAHPGVSSYGLGSKKPIRKHMYYQWVPFFLFGQAIFFYLTRLLWKKLEDNRIHKLIVGLNYSKFALLDKEQKINDEIIPSREKKLDSIRKIKDAFLNRVRLNKSWARSLIFCEFLNLLNVIFQFYITNGFLGRKFYNLGPRFITNGSKILDEVFPKVTKCTFYKYGPSGSIQVHDALCVLALNIINEKIYIFLWFWFVILFVVSSLVIIWRCFTICFYSRSTAFNQLIFGNSLRGKMYPWHVKTVIQNCNYSDWIFLKYLSKNIDGLAFRELFLNISDEIEEKEPLFSKPKQKK